MIRAALYARVSSERQQHEKTIESQLEELRARIKADGFTEWEEFADEGYSRDNLVRPRLDKLRDIARQDGKIRVYVHTPDRLASGTSLMVVYDEFRDRGAEVVFLSGPVEDTPEGHMFLGFQGLIGEYEKVKIAERTRRGRMYWARAGALVGFHLPFGYRFVHRTDKARARLEIDDSQAEPVRLMYAWMLEGFSTRAITKRLIESCVPTSKGAVRWQPSTVQRILKNTAYRGVMQFHKSEVRRKAPEKSGGRYREVSTAIPESEWIEIPVPAIVDEATWYAVQKRLAENSRFASRNNKRHKYLLRGLVRCPRCSGAYTGAYQGGARRYRCTRADPFTSPAGKVCRPPTVRADRLETTVWIAVSEILQDRDLLKSEYERQLAYSGASNGPEAEQRLTGVAIKRIKTQQDRLTDAYTTQAIELEEFKKRMDALRQQMHGLQERVAALQRQANQHEAARSALDELDSFSDTVGKGLANLTFVERQKLLRLVVERVVAKDDRVRVEVAIPVGTGAALRTGDPEWSEGEGSGVGPGVISSPTSQDSSPRSE